MIAPEIEVNKKVCYLHIHALSYILGYLNLFLSYFRSSRRRNPKEAEMELNMMKSVKNKINETTS